LKSFLEFTIVDILVLHCFRSCCSYLYRRKHGSLHIAKLWLNITHWLDRPVSNPALHTPCS